MSSRQKRSKQERSPTTFLSICHNQTRQNVQLKEKRKLLQNFSASKEWYHAHVFLNRLAAHQNKKIPDFTMTLKQFSLTRENDYSDINHQK